MALPKLTIDFSNFWAGFNKQDNLIKEYLESGFTVEIGDKPDILVYSCFGDEHLNFSGPKIFYTGENERPDFRECDFAFSFEYDEHGGRNVRFPLYRWQVDLEKLTVPKDAAAIFDTKTKFCCMLVSNPGCAERNSFYEKLSKYKKVDSGGRYMNNVGGPVADKAAFIRDYKFVLSFENSSTPGYTTEKIAEPMFTDSVAVYWGNALIEKEFNKDCFVNVHAFNSFDAAIEHLIELDKNDEAFKKMLATPCFENNTVPANMTHDYFRRQWLGAVHQVLRQPYVNRGLQQKMNIARAASKRLKNKISNKLKGE